MWHASIALHSRGRAVHLSEALPVEHLARARRALQSVGDPAAGEWVEIGDVAVHLRRRVSEAEWAGREWGRDLRHSIEGRVRLLNAGLPAGFPPEEW